MQYVIDIMIYLGSALMVYNIYGFIRFARYIKGKKTWNRDGRILHIPIVLLVFFLAGYLVIGVFGAPDMMMACILLGGSVFVFVMYRMLNKVILQVSENEHLEAELIASEESSRAKMSFLASISHEMRTPMNVILGMDTLALKNPDLPGQTRDQLEKIGQSARHLAGLIDNILDMQETDIGEEPIHRGPFCLRDALDQINAVIAVMCEEKGLTYETSFGACADGEYIGDATQLRRALMNILDNAVKFTDAPGTIRFEVTCREEDGVCVEEYFTISDTGVGIEEEFLPKIFDAFAQEDASFTNRFGGSGTGLPAARSIVARMGGRIEVSSSKNKGSVFRVCLPLTPCEKEKTPEETDSRIPEPSVEEFSLEGCRVLIVEDLPENAEIVQDLLELEGVESDLAQNGQIAVDMIRKSEQYTYDAILMDLRMPEMDGLEAAGRIRALPRSDAKSVPIIALTANAYESDVRNSLNAGMNGHLAKPIDADRLVGELKKWIRKAKGEGGTVET